MLIPSVDRVIENGSTKRTNFRWAVMGMIFVMFTISFADRANIGALLPVITKEFSLTNFQAGAIASFFFLGYLITQIPGGLLASKYGTRSGLINSVAVRLA
jgi:fucose permease